FRILIGRVHLGWGAVTERVFVTTCTRRVTSRRFSVTRRTRHCTSGGGNWGYNRGNMSEPIKGIRRWARDYARSMAFWLPVGLLVGWKVYGMYISVHATVSFPVVLRLQTARYFVIALMTPPVFYCVERWPVTSAAIRRAAAYAVGRLPFSLVL